MCEKILRTVLRPLGGGELKEETTKERKGKGFYKGTENERSRFSFSGIQGF